MLQLRHTCFVALLDECVTRDVKIQIKIDTPYERRRIHYLADTRIDCSTQH